MPQINQGQRHYASLFAASPLQFCNSNGEIDFQDWPPYISFPAFFSTSLQTQYIIISSEDYKLTDSMERNNFSCKLDVKVQTRLKFTQTVSTVLF